MCVLVYCNTGGHSNSEYLDISNQTINNFRKILRKIRFRPFQIFHLVCCEHTIRKGSTRRGDPILLSIPEVSKTQSMRDAVV